jgi:hypothetical protein
MKEESFMEMFKEIENNPELSGIMETMMERFMSKEVLYEGLKELHDKVGDFQSTKYA